MRARDELRQACRTIFDAGLAAVDPYQAVTRTLRLDGDRLYFTLPDRPQACLEMQRFDRVVVVGAGKATAPMARAVEAVLSERLDEGLIVVKYGHGEPLQRTRVIEAAHPVPDAAGLDGARQIVERVGRLDERTLLIVLISGGGSALLPLPAAGLTLEEKQETTRLLLAAGADIGEINCVRKHLSAVKGGQLARCAAPATVVSLMLSDVVGDHLDVIASGPTVADASTFADARGVMQRYGIWEGAPPGVKRRLDAGCQGDIEETPKPFDPLFVGHLAGVIGGNRVALAACEVAARADGWNTLVLASTLEGETADVARVHSAIAAEIRQTGRPVPPPACIISGGETTVTLRGEGKGGRNQEFALAAAAGIAGLAGVAVFSAGTDGTDGPTDAAGGIVFGDSVQRAAACGMAWVPHLEGHDAYPLLERIGDLVVTGPTGTNVMDVHLILVDEERP